MLINIEVEAIKSEVHLNYPVDTTEEEKVRIKSRKSSFKVQKTPREVLRRKLTK